MSRDDAFGNRPAWVALFTLPAVVTLVSIARNLFGYRAMEELLGFTAMAAVPDPLYAELLGLCAAAFVALVVGPHLALLLSLGALVLLWGAFTVFGVSWDHWGSLFAATTLETAALATALGAIGSSTGGGAPGLRYATASFAWVGWILAPLLARAVGLLLPVSPAYVAPGLLMTAVLMALFPTVVWWTSQRHPRPASADATYRVAGVTGVAFAVVSAVWAVDSMRSMALLGTSMPGTFGSPGYLAHVVAAVGMGSLLGLVALVLQVMGRPARIGWLTGVGCLLISLAGLWVWNSDQPWLLPIGLLAGIGHAMILPWVWARVASDVHWRLATVFAGVILFAPHTIDNMTQLWAVVAMTALALSAIAVGALGWFGDDWVYGDIPGSSLDRRGR